MKLLKWEDATVGIINTDNSIEFVAQELNSVVKIYTQGKLSWTPSDYKQFIQDRIVSSSRRDIEKILHKAGLVKYDEFKLADITRLLNAKDLFWVAFDREEKMTDVLKNVFDSIFLRKSNVQGDSVSSPEGMNIKRYAVSEGNYGILKDRLHPYSTDVESEVAVYNIGKLLGVQVCPAWLVKTQNKTSAFSRFEYNFAQEFIVHTRRLFTDKDRSDNEYVNLVTKLGHFKKEIQQMILLDFITRQTDRHLSNLAVKIHNATTTLYPLYDNGRSLFYEDKEEFMEKAINNIELYSSEFGPVGTYLDHIKDFASGVDIGRLIDLNVTKDSIYNSYKKAEIPPEKLEYAAVWSFKCIELLRRF